MKPSPVLPEQQRTEADRQGGATLRDNKQTGTTANTIEPPREWQPEPERTSTSTWKQNNMSHGSFAPDVPSSVAVTSLRCRNIDTLSSAAGGKPLSVIVMTHVSDVTQRVPASGRGPSVTAGDNTSV
jgi:hypothetical protein